MTALLEKLWAEDDGQDIVEYGSNVGRYLGAGCWNHSACRI